MISIVNVIQKLFESCRDANEIPKMQNCTRTVLQITRQVPESLNDWFVEHQCTVEFGLDTGPDCDDSSVPPSTRISERVRDFEEMCKIFPSFHFLEDGAKSSWCQYGSY